MIGDQGARRVLALEGLALVIAHYENWREALPGPIEAYDALVAAGREPLPAARRKELEAHVVAALKRSSGTADPAAHAAAMVLHALSDALWKFVDAVTVTLGHVRDVLVIVGTPSTVVEAHVETWIKRAEELGDSDAGWEEGFAELTALLVSPEGKATTVQGDIVRLVGEVAATIRRGKARFDERHHETLSQLDLKLARAKCWNPLQKDTIRGATMKLWDHNPATNEVAYRILARYAVRYCVLNPP